MTGQAADQFFYGKHRLEIVGIKGTSLTTAKDFGIELASASTGCWRGYIMRYKIIEKKLVIDGFWVNTRSKKEMPEINGILPTQDHEIRSLFKYEYRNLNLKVPFNGSIWLGKDFINSQYVHMGFQSPTAYRTVLKLDLKDGIIVNVEDKSNEIEKAREDGDPKGYRPDSMSSETIHDWVMRRFSLNLPSKEEKPESLHNSIDKVKQEMLEELDRLNKLKDKE
ncbi:MAG: hypothetical protein GF317_24940 [Candidatus Lokiarchaeota archaeon]|nr:hypothetical protein [Candidatus Lokiarchaeota archaeon]MBD3202606.1 hypothetical protein [Candidatus Lokiarchaeota archaeon]